MSTMKFPVATIHTWLDEWLADLGASPYLQLRTGPPEASVAATATGVMTHELALPSSPFTSPFNGTISKTGTWTGNAVAVGVIGHARILNNAKSGCFWVGSVTQAVAYALTADAAANQNVLQVADTSGIVLGSGVAGVGVQDGTTVAGKTSTTVILSKTMKTIMFTDEIVVVGDTSGDLLISGAYIANVGDPATVVSWTIGWPDLF